MKLLLTIVLSGILFSAFAGDITIYVSHNGNGKGTLQAPASLQKALAMLPGLKKNNPKGTISIILQDGEYELNQPINITLENGGTKDLKIIFEAAKNAHPVISGGKKIEMKGGRILSAYMSCAALSQPYDIYINGKRAVRARTPNINEYFTGKMIDKDTVRNKLNQQGVALYTRRYGVPSEIFNELAILPKSTLHKIRPNIYCLWDINMPTIDSLDNQTQSFYFTGKDCDYLKKFSSLFYVENYPFALDTANEWYISNDTIKYIPSEKVGQQEAIVPVLEKLMTIKGDSSLSVQNIVFDRIAFKYCNHIFQGYEFYQAAQSIDAAIMIDNAENINFTQCEITHTGQGAIWLRKGVRNCNIASCYIHDLGGAGVRIGETVLRENKVQWTSGNKVENCIIHSGGLNFPSAEGVFIAHSGNNIIAHNDIADFRYTGISVGWVWGFGFSPSINNKILYNHIHHIGWGVLSDMGAVYTLGISDGTEVSHNRIHDVYSYYYGGWGLYNDEGSSNIRMENNLVYRTKTGGYHQHYGKDNLISNNIFAFNEKFQAQFSKIVNYKSFTFTHNIVMSDSGFLLHGVWEHGVVTVDNNCYWNMNNKNCVFMESTMNFGDSPQIFLTFKQWQQTSGNDAHSVMQDPGFVDAKKYNFKFRDESVIKQIGFEPFDPDQAGVIGDKQWQELAKLPKETIAAFNVSVAKNMLHMQP